MKRIIRERFLTPAEAEKYDKIRAEIAKELPDLIAQHRKRMADQDLRAIANAAFMPMYPESIQLAVARGTCPDGGSKRIECLFSFIPKSGRTLIVTRWGYFDSGLPSSFNKSTALHQLRDPALMAIYGYRLDQTTEDAHVWEFSGV